MNVRRASAAVRRAAAQLLRECAAVLCSEARTSVCTRMTNEAAHVNRPDLRPPPPARQQCRLRRPPAGAPSGLAIICSVPAPHPHQAGRQQAAREARACLQRSPAPDRDAMAAARAAFLLCLALLAAGQAAAQPASDISLSGVTVALLEAGGGAADSHPVARPDAAKQLGTLDHTRTLKVGAAAAGGGGGQPTPRSPAPLGSLQPISIANLPPPPAGRAERGAGGRARLPAAAGVPAADVARLGRRRLLCGRQGQGGPAVRHRQGCRAAEAGAAASVGGARRGVHGGARARPARQQLAGWRAAGPAAAAAQAGACPARSPAQPPRRASAPLTVARRWASRAARSTWPCWWATRAARSRWTGPWARWPCCCRRWTTARSRRTSRTGGGRVARWAAGWARLRSGAARLPRVAAAVVPHSVRAAAWLSQPPLACTW